MMHNKSINVKLILISCKIIKLANVCTLTLQAHNPPDKDGRNLVSEGNKVPRPFSKKTCQIIKKNSECVKKT